MWLIVGLGNPGTRYAHNRHNVGFHVVDVLASRHKLPAFRSKHGGELTSGNVAREKALLLKPMEYMNLSGFAVQRTARFHRVEPSRMVVIHDEIDFALGRVQVKSGGGHGGHNGLRSIFEQLGDKSFTRVRVGIGRPGAQGDSGAGHAGSSGDSGPGDRRVASYVLSNFPADDAETVSEMVERAADAVELVMRDGLRVAMNAMNRTARAKKTEKGSDDEAEAPAKASEGDA